MRLARLSVALVLAATAASAKTPATAIAPATQPTTATTLFSGWGLTPAGQHVQIGDVPLKMTLSPDRKTLAAVCGGLHTGLAIYDVPTRKLRQFIPLHKTWNGVAFSADGKQIFATGGNSNALYTFAFDGTTATQTGTFNLDPDAKGPFAPTTNFFAAVAVHPKTGDLYVCNEAASEIWVVRPSDGKVRSKLRTGAHPHTCLFGANPRFLYVSNWGDRSVTAIDVETGKQALRIPVGIRPNDMALAPDGRLFVACAGDNTVHVVQTKSPKSVDGDTDESAAPPDSALEIVSTSLYAASPEGSTPCGVAVSPDGKVLFVVNADNNDCLVADISRPEVTTVTGFVPTGWYPTAVASDGKTLFVANGKGLGNFGPNVPATSDAKRTVLGTRFDHPTGKLSGSISAIDEPTADELNAYTRQVRKNSPYTPDEFRRASAPNSSIIPSDVGADCPIKHVLYIIKENRTYDQVMGDMTDAAGKPIGNGDPKLTLYGETVTPNQHQLARDYVLLDNLYCSAEVSVDGHSWSDGAIATDYNQRSWLVRYTKHGALPGNADMQSPAGGYIWDLCKRHGVTFKTYGEGSKFVPSSNRGTWKAARDMNKVDGWISDLREAEKTGVLPQFMIMALGENHTKGSTPGEFTPKSCVASNDIGLGKIVEAASRSKFWKEMAIFVIEDDAQNGPDHVDSHRTVGLVISPYTKRNFVDSTPYTTTSMLRTMELILGLPPMTQHDAAATPMFNSFDRDATVTPHVLLKPKVDLAARNTKDSPGATASAKMDFDEVDEAPEDELNRILWLVEKGSGVPYPTPLHRALFTK
jgi:YVTN family beta-propeller protein